MAADPVRAAHEADRRQLCAELGEPAMSWGEALTRVGELAREERARRGVRHKVEEQCRATSGGDRCSRAAGHSGSHHCDDPSFSWSF